MRQDEPGEAPDDGGDEDEQQERQNDDERRAANERGAVNETRAKSIVPRQSTALGDPRPVRRQERVDAPLRRPESGSSKARNAPGRKQGQRERRVREGAEARWPPSMYARSNVFSWPAAAARPASAVTESVALSPRTRSPCGVRPRLRRHRSGPSASPRRSRSACELSSSTYTSAVHASTQKSRDRASASKCSANHIAAPPSKLPTSSSLRGPAGSAKTGARPSAPGRRWYVNSAAQLPEPPS